MIERMNELQKESELKQVCGIDSSNNDMKITTQTMRRKMKSRKERRIIMRMKIKEKQELKQQKKKECQMKYKEYKNEQTDSDSDSDYKQFVFTDKNPIDLKSDDSFYEFSRIGLVWKYGSCSLLKGDYMLDLSIQGQDAVTMCGFIFTDKCSVELLRLNEQHKHPSKQKISIFPILNPYQRWLKDNFRCRPNISNLKKAKKIETELNRELIVHKSYKSNKSKHNANKSELISILGNESKAHLYYLGTQLLYGPHYYIIFNPIKNCIEFGRDVQIQAKFQSGTKGMIILKQENNERVSQIVSCGEEGIQSMKLKVPNRNSEINLSSDQPFDSSSNFNLILQRGKVFNNNQQSKQILRIIPFLEFDNMNRKSSYSISYQPPCGYQCSVQKVAPVWEMMKYETIWQDSIIGTTSDQISNLVNYKYRFCIIRTCNATDILLQIISFCWTTWRHYRNPSFKVIKLNEILNSPTEIQRKLEKLKSDQQNIYDSLPIFSNDNKCVCESVDINYFKDIDKDAKICCPCGSSWLPSGGDYLVQFKVKGPDSLTMIGFVWTNTPIQVFCLSN